MTKPTVFISYSHADSEFVDQLAEDLKASGVDVWIDKWMIKVGDSITGKINEGIGESDFLIVVLSRSSVNSKWVREELNAAQIRNIEQNKHAFILPVLLEDCNIPELLKHRRYADFTRDQEQAFRELLEVVNPVKYPAHRRHHLNRQSDSSADMNKQGFTDEEKELLVAASKRGELRLLSAEQIPGKWVRAGGKNFVDKENPAYAAKYREALQSLCKRGYVTQESESYFTLTSLGYERARELVT